MKKFVKTSLKISSAILACAIAAPVLVVTAIMAQAAGLAWVAIMFLTFLVMGALIGLSIGYKIVLGRKTKIMQENVNLETRLKLSWDNNSFLQGKIKGHQDTLRQYETLIKDLNKAQQNHKKEVGILEKSLVEHMEEKAKLAVEVSRLNAKLEAEKAARIESAAKHGQKELHLDILKERHIEHLQKARKAKKVLQRKVELLEDELNLLNFMYEEYWVMKQKYEPNALNPNTHSVIIDKNVQYLGVLAGISNIKLPEEDIKLLKEAV